MSDKSIEDMVTKQQIDVPLFIIKEVKDKAAELEISVDSYIVTSVQIMNSFMESVEESKVFFVKRAAEYDMLRGLVSAIKDGTNDEEWNKLVSMSKDRNSSNEDDLDDQLSELFR